MDIKDIKNLPLILPSNECSNDDYHNGFLKGFVGSTTLGMMDRLTPIQVLLDTFTENEATKVGSAFHLLMESEEEFGNKVLFAGKDGRSKEYKEAMSGEKDKIVLTEKWSPIIHGMRNSILQHPDVLSLIKHHSSRFEVTAAINDVLKLKCRPDVVRQGIIDETKDIIIDYKTTKSVAPDRFATSVKDYSYHIQAAHYIYVWERATKRKVEDFIFIAVEKERPHLCNVFRLDEDTLEEGRVAHKKAMYKYKNCAETDIWGGYEQVVHTLRLKRWDFKHTKPKQHGIT